MKCLFPYISFIRPRPIAALCPYLVLGWWHKIFSLLLLLLFEYFVWRIALQICVCMLFIERPLYFYENESFLQLHNTDNLVTSKTPVYPQLLTVSIDLKMYFYCRQCLKGCWFLPHWRHAISCESHSPYSLSAV